MDRDNSNFPTDYKRYKIVEILEINESVPKFHIQVQRRFLWWKWWEYVENTYKRVGDAYSTTEIINYRSKKLAEQRIYFFRNEKKFAQEKKARLKREAIEERDGRKVKFYDYYPTKFGV